MSLLNEMLKDIEKKKATDAREKLITPNLGTANWSRQFQSYLRITVLSVIFANVIIASAIWVTKHRSVSIKTKQTTVVENNKPTMRHVVRLSKLPTITELKDKQLTQVVASSEQPQKVTVDDIKKESRPTTRENSITMYQQALKAIQLGKVEQGSDLLEQIVQSDPMYFDAWNSLIIVDIDGNRLKQALQKIEKAMQLFPNSLALVQHKARLLMKSGRYKESIAQLLQRRPNIESSPNYYALLAALYEKTSDSLKAGEIYQMLVQLYPENANYWLGFALALEHAEHLNQALSAYQKVLESYNPSPVVAAFARERMLKLRG